MLRTCDVGRADLFQKILPAGILSAEINTQGTPGFQGQGEALPPNLVLGDLVAQSIPTNAENAGGFSLVGSSLLQSACDDTSLAVSNDGGFAAVGEFRSSSCKGA